MTIYEELAISAGGYETRICHDYPQPTPGETVRSEMWVCYEFDWVDYAIVWGDPTAQLGGGVPVEPPSNPQTAAMVLFF